MLTALFTRCQPLPIEGVRWFINKCSEINCLCTFTNTWILNSSNMNRQWIQFCNIVEITSTAGQLQHAYILPFDTRNAGLFFSCVNLRLFKVDG